MECRIWVLEFWGVRLICEQEKSIIMSTAGLWGLMKKA